MTTKPAPVKFETTLTAFGNNTGIVVPPEPLAALGAGKRPPVSVDLNGYVYRTTVGAIWRPRTAAVTGCRVAPGSGGTAT